MNNFENTISPNSASQELTLSNKPRIPLEEAMARAENWRSLVVQIPGGNAAADFNTCIGLDVPKQRIFRAININIADVKDLLADQPKAKAIRLYLSLQDPEFPYQITGMLVPVDANNRDMLTKKISADDTSSVSGILSNATASTIYDFTQPCPSLCDTSSPLFNSDNSVENYI
ncbi:hypothetical protein [Mucilaginibacter dorajii]|uniref:Uncharacterized protein n=1 Tax=Mucilaginibacter dorajii TaxID=692994 RepID=A0ABP7QGZ0_9SPHI|nr:hypothetical protein [Mucilaginibacter dorajii]MCS3736103.1 hypothetical protein [Mucilaginibacter dorajii]